MSTLYRYGIAAMDIDATDINNIECVTYTQGDYTGLATNLQQALAPLIARS
jgi:hypothetical protein